MGVAMIGVAIGWELSLAGEARLGETKAQLECAVCRERSLV